MKTHTYIHTYTHTHTHTHTHTQLLISYLRQHNPVTTDKVSRWLKEFLGLSGIDTSTLTEHSTKTASAYKAKQVGLS